MNKKLKKIIIISTFITLVTLLNITIKSEVMLSTLLSIIPFAIIFPFMMYYKIDLSTFGIGNLILTIIGSSFVNTIFYPTDDQIELLRVLVANSFNLSDDFINLNILKNVISCILYSITFIVVILMNKILKDNTITQKHPNKIVSLFDSNFTTRRLNFCKSLERDLHNLNLQTNWNDRYFTPLDAEVIFDSNMKIKKKKRDLIKTLRTISEHDTFLILGEPGSGKSTILRKLASDLLKETKKTNKIPIYINLKEWKIANIYTVENPPNMNILLNFIKGNLKFRLTNPSDHKFIDDYFDLLYEEGFFYFILDSFDEIPILLDVPQNYWLIDRLSYLLYDLIKHNSNSKGILSSRYYKKPTNYFKTSACLHIKPFTEHKVSLCIKNAIGNSSLLNKICQEKPFLLQLAKNPFNANLIISYYQHNNYKLPNCEADLYNSFIHHQIESCEEKQQLLSKNNLTTEFVMENLYSIALAIFNNNDYGIDIPKSVLTDKIGIPKEIITILEKTKLVRIGKGDITPISFSHRRFNEYLVAKTLINKGTKEYKDSIPENSKWRDTLVLYCQICTQESSDQLINYCFKHIENIDKNSKTKQIIVNDNYRKALHSFRFLIDAFINIPERLYAKSSVLIEFRNMLLESQNFLHIEMAIATLYLLPTDEIENTMNEISLYQYDWLINDIIIYYLTSNKVNHFVNIKILRYFYNLSCIDFNTKYKTIKYLLNNSNNKILMLYFSLRNFYAYLLITLLFVQYIIESVINNKYIDYFTSLSSLIILSLIRTNIFYLFYIFVIPLSVFNIKAVKKVFILFGSMIWKYLIIISSIKLIIENRNLYSMSLYLGLITFILFDIILFYMYNLFHINIKKIKNDIKKIKERIWENRKPFSILLFTLLTIARPLNLFITNPNNFMFVMGFTIILFILVLLKNAINLSQDNIVTKNINYHNTIKRSEVENTLISLKSSKYKLIYLNQIMDKNIDAYGEWAEDSMPQFNNYDVNKILAHLEMKWLGL